MSLEVIISAALGLVVVAIVVELQKWETKQWQLAGKIVREVACGTVVMLSTFACIMLGVIFFAEFLNILVCRLVSASSAKTTFDYDNYLEKTLIIGNPTWAILLFIFSYYCIQRFQLPTVPTTDPSKS